MGKIYLAAILLVEAVLPFAASATQPIPIITPAPVRLPTDEARTGSRPMFEIVQTEEGKPQNEPIPVIEPVAVRLPEPLPVSVPVEAGTPAQSEQEVAVSSTSAPPPEGKASVADAAPENTPERKDIAIPQAPEPTSAPAPMPVIIRTGGQPRLRNAIISEEPSVSMAPL